MSKGDFLATLLIICDPLSACFCLITVLIPGPANIFSARSRSDLNKEELLLSNGVLNSAVKLNFDLSGFSDEEGMAFTQHSDANTKKAKEVEAAFSDIEALIAQIEEKR